MRTTAAAGCAAVVVIAAALLASPSDSQEPRTVRDGVFSAAQVARGERSFLWECMDCHEVAEFTTERGYLEQMEGKTMWEVYDYVRRNMPEDRPSWLRPSTYVDILAYILSEYGLPRGETDLAVDRATLESIVIVGPGS